MPAETSVHAANWTEVLEFSGLQEGEALESYHWQIGDIVRAPNDFKRGGGPAWLAAIVTDVHTKWGGSLEGGDPSIFVVTWFYPVTGPAARPDDRLSWKDLGKKWKPR